MPTRSLKKVETGKTEKGISRHKGDNTPLTPQSQLKIEEAAKMITKGKGMNDVIEFIRDKYKISYEQSRHYWVAACRFLVADMDETREALIKQNIQRLERIINKSMENEDYKLAKETIGELNKMLGVGKDGVSIAVRNDPENNTQEFIIKVD